MSTTTYIGVKMIEAEPQERDGVPGYRVVYPDGYESWSPASTFEAAYLPIQAGDRISREDVEGFLSGGEEGTRMGNHAVLMVRALSGFSYVDESACVDPANYDQAMGESIARGRIRERAWEHLGFLLAWARNGLGR